MDPLSITASIAAILQLSGTVVRYLSEVKSATSGRQKILSEVVSRFEVARAGLWQLELLGVEPQWSVASVKARTPIIQSSFRTSSEVLLLRVHLANLPLFQQVVALSGLLYHLRNLVEQDQQKREWLETMRSLSVPDGPLDQLRGSLGFLSAKLAPQEGLKKVGKALSWPFHGQEVREVLEAMERQKFLISLAMQNDLI
ncbi:MAG: hypothetical protein M1813_006068 [Trichoglossum hirsutum]|nr:MAG: hypothetical protein M1813_006068 [Trichoglossum hirsutum]